MNKQQPLISCIIIFFNAGKKFFIEAIESVLDQTYDNWELLLVDDGSTDESTKIALQYVQRYPQKIRYLEHENHQNRGMSATRNLGIRHAQGKYIAFLDADDVWLSNTLEEQIAILETYPDAAMVFGPIQWWYSWTGNIEDEKRDFVEQWVESSEIQINTLVQPSQLFLLLLQGKISISGMLVKKKIAVLVNGFEEEFKGLYEDQVFCSKICLNFPVFIAAKWWYKYRQHPNSCCAITEKYETEYWRINRPNFLNWLEQYLLERGFKNTEAWQQVRQESWQYRHPILNLLKTTYLFYTNKIQRKFLKITSQNKI